MRADCSSRSLDPETASYEVRRPRDARSRGKGARQAWAQRERQREHIKQKRLIPHNTPYSHRLLSRKRRPRRGRQRRPPPTARPRRRGTGAGCEGSPQEAAASRSRRRWHHPGGRRRDVRHEQRVDDVHRDDESMLFEKSRRPHGCRERGRTEAPQLRTGRTRLSRHRRRQTARRLAPCRPRRRRRCP